MTVLQSELIDMLKARPNSELDHGWNLALITLLKRNNLPAQHPLLILNIQYDEIVQIDECIRNSNKLMAIKLIKEYTGMGLKDAKDTLDNYVDTNLWRTDSQK